MTDNPYQRPAAPRPEARWSLAGNQHLAWLLGSLLVYWFGGPAVCAAALGRQRGRSVETTALVLWILVQVVALVTSALALRAFLRRGGTGGMGGCVWLVVWLGHTAVVTILGLTQLSALAR